MTGATAGEGRATAKGLACALCAVALETLSSFLTQDAMDTGGDISSGNRNTNGGSNGGTEERVWARATVYAVLVVAGFVPVAGVALLSRGVAGLLCPSTSAAVHDKPCKSNSTKDECKSNSTTDNE